LTTKDSIVMAAPDLVAEYLRLALGEGWEAILLSDLVADSIPTHIIGSKVFLLLQGNERFVAKIGDHASLATEEIALKSLLDLARQSRTFPFDSINLPIPQVLIDLKPIDLAALITSFNGIHTLEVYRIQNNSQAVEEGLQRVLGILGEIGIAWPSIMARNIVLDYRRNKNDIVLCPVDWELGFYDIPYAQDSVQFYTRCIELLEESATFASDVLPYWSTRWPSPSELAAWSSPYALQGNISLDGDRDPRITTLKDLLLLPNRITDGQYFRLIQVLCSLCERKPTLYSVLFAADQLSEWAGLEFRIKCTLLSWYLQRADEALRDRLHLYIVRTAHQIFRYWRGGVKEEDTRVAIHTLIRHLQDEVDRLAMIKLGMGDWSKLLVDECRKFILEGTNVDAPTFRVLHYLEGGSQ